MKYLKKAGVTLVQLNAAREIWYKKDICFRWNPRLKNWLAGKWSDDIEPNFIKMRCNHLAAREYILNPETLITAFEKVSCT